MNATKPDRFIFSLTTTRSPARTSDGSNPFGNDSFKEKQPDAEEFILEEGATLTPRYRLVLHQGDLASANLWAEFSE